MATNVLVVLFHKKNNQTEVLSSRSSRSIVFWWNINCFSSFFIQNYLCSLLVSSVDGNKGIQELYISSEKIIHLPVKVAETSPNLLVYSTHSCSVKEISKQNFNDMVKLLWLRLINNQIEKIASGTFEDLAALEKLDLSE